MTCWGSVWLALQVEGGGGPPTSRNNLLGVDVAGVAGGGGESAPKESRWLVGGGWGWCRRWRGRESPQQVVMTHWGLMWLASQVEGERVPLGWGLFFSLRP